MITLKPHETLGVTYYYTFDKEVILCVSAENVINGVIKNDEFIFPGNSK